MTASPSCNEHTYLKPAKVFKKENLDIVTWIKLERLFINKCG